MESETLGARWDEQFLPRWALPWTRRGVLVLGLVCSYGAALGTRASVLLIFLTVPGWLLLSLLTALWAQHTARFQVALALAFGCTLLGVWLVQHGVPLVRYPNGHPPFGEHPVTMLAGFPWAGVEGTAPYWYAMEAIPLDMGVDALLVNLTAFLLPLWLAMKRVPPRVMRWVLPVACLFAAFATLYASPHLVILFD